MPLEGGFVLVDVGQNLAFALVCVFSRGVFLAERFLKERLRQSFIFFLFLPFP